MNRKEAGDPVCGVLWSGQRLPMAKKERIRESLTGLPTLEYLMQRIEMGWRPSAIEWERDILPAGAEQPYTEEIPYGLQVSPDCAGLVENPTEKEVVTMAIDLI